MRKSLIMAVVVLQVLILAYMAAEREWILRTGERLFLRTAPVDPRDPFRGDYVRLNYEISTIPKSKIEGGAVSEEGSREKKVYVFLKKGPDNVAHMDHATYGKPGSGLFIRGRHRGWFGDSHNKQVQVRYGIEAYFVPQGQGRQMERGLLPVGDIQVPLEIEVALGKDGTAVIRDYRWGPVGAKLEVLEKPSGPKEDGRKSAKVRFTLINVSKKPLALVDLPNMCSFALEDAAPVGPGIEPAFTGCSTAQIADAAIFVLEPKEKRSFDFDLTNERWHVIQGGKEAEIGELIRHGRLRIAYRPPERSLCVGLPHAELIYYGAVTSGPFAP